MKLRSTQAQKGHAAPVRRTESSGGGAAGAGAAPLQQLAQRLGNRGMGQWIDSRRGLAQRFGMPLADLQIRSDEQAADETAQTVLGGGSLSGTSPAPPLPAPGAESAGRGDLPEHVRRALAEDGEPLPVGLASRLAIPMGIGLDEVRVHRGPDAVTSAAALGAEAYAYGRDLVFGDGRWQPHRQAGQALIAHELAHVAQQRRSAPRIQMKKGGAPAVTYLEVPGASFDEAAANFAAMLANKPKISKARIVIVNGPNVKVYDETGKVVENKFFHLTAPAFLPIGVFGRSAPGSRALHAVGLGPNGEWYDAGAVQVQGGIDFERNIDDQEGFNKALGAGVPTFFVSPSSTAVPPTADAPAPAPIENLPEFMQFEAKSTANLPAWPSATLPLTSQVATVNSTGTFVCRVDKNQGLNLIDRVTNLMQTTHFRWEVLKLDEKLHVKGKKRTTGWDAAVEGFARRKRQLADDREAMLGDRRRQSIPERVFRQAMVEQTATARETLAMVGQTVMTVVNAIAGGPNQLTTEDVMDVPFKEQGDFFVRCLATQVVPPNAKFRRATSVSGVMVSVYDIEEVTRNALFSGTELSNEADKSAAQVQTEIDQLDKDYKAGVGDPVINRSERAYKQLSLDYFKDLSAAGGNPLNAKVAEQTLLDGQIAFFNSDQYPDGEKYKPFKEAMLAKVNKRLKEVKAELKRMRGALKERDAQIEPVGFMRAMFVDEVSSAKQPLTFSVGERRYIAADNLEVVIADVTGSKGRTFSGTGGGALGAGREDAWLDAMTDLRQNLNRGRGWISYEVPAPYQKWKNELPNPMKLQMSAKAQIKETIDDTAHALTIAALLAAPFTGGASLSILAVLAPIQAASSLYNIVNRALYDDLELDQEAVFDLINVATLGLGKVSTLGKAGSRGLEIIAASSKIAIRLLNGGQFIVVSYETFNTLMEEGDPNDDPQELRRKKLLKLLSWCEQAAIPVSEKLFGEAHGGARRRGKTETGKEAGLLLEEPKQTLAESRLKARLKKGGEAEAKRAPPETKVETPGETAKPDATVAPAKPVEVPVFKPTRTQLRGVPEALRGKVAVVEGMGKDAKIVYKRGANGLITDVQIHIGERATAADVKTHAAVAELMLKYSGLGGRMRRLLDRFINLFAKPEAQRPEIGSRAWEAKYELLKLDRMMRERHADLAKLADLPAEQRDATQVRDLLSELDSLELQFKENADVYSAIEMGTRQGRGYVAAEGLSEGERIRLERKLPEAPPGYRWRWRRGALEVVADPGMPKRYFDEKAPSTAAWEKRFPIDKRVGIPERFDAGTGRAQAFRELGGYDPKSSFGAFVKVLMDQGVIRSRQEVINAMGEPANRTHDTVRGNVKEVFRQQLVDQITDAKYLRKQSKYREIIRSGGSVRDARRAAAMDELVRLSAELDSADRGTLGERVYDKLFGTKKSVTQIDVTPAQLAAARGVPESEIPKGRRIDRMDGNRAREVKNVSSRMGVEQRGEIDDMIALIGSEVQPRRGPPRKLESVSVAFLDPLGGKANASLALDILEANPKADLTFEFHTRDGKVLHVTYKNRQVLEAADFASKLGLP